MENFDKPKEDEIHRFQNGNRPEEELRSFSDGMGEALGIFLDSLWKDQVKPKVAKLFSAVESRVAARRASQDAFSRLSSEDPETDEAYAHLI